jgi:hypothetical protein
MRRSPFCRALPSHVPPSIHPVDTRRERTVDEWREREVRNEVHSRDRNEWIETANNRYQAHRATEVYVCECSDGGCTVVLTLTRAEYEGVRARGTHFAIALDHENPEVDRVVSENERFAVVEKFLTMPRRVALETDPRR